MVLSASVTDTAALAARLDATGVVKTVLVDETRWPGTVTGLFAHRRAARDFEKLCGWKLNRAAFENVYMHNDCRVLVRYLEDCRAGYILCEDTFGSTLGPDQHLVTDQRAAADFAAKEAFLKAAGTGLREPFSLCEIEVLRLPSGAPVYCFSGRTAAWVEEHHVMARLSLSHDGGMALAFCVLEQAET